MAVGIIRSSIFFIVIICVSAHKHVRTDESDSADVAFSSDRNNQIKGVSDSAPDRSEGKLSNKVDETAGIFANALGTLFGSSTQGKSEEKKWSWTEGATNFVKDCAKLFSNMISWSSSDGASRGGKIRKGESISTRTDESGSQNNNNEKTRRTSRVTRSVSDVDEDTAAASVTTSLYIVACYMGGWGCKNSMVERDTGAATAQHAAYSVQVANGAAQQNRGNAAGGGSPGVQGGYQESAGSWSAGSSGSEDGEQRPISKPDGTSHSGHLTSAKSTWAEVTSGLPKSLSSVRASVTDTAERTRTSVSDTASSAVTSVGRWLGDTSERAGDIGASAGEAWDKTRGVIEGRVSSVQEKLSSSTGDIGARINSKWAEFKSGAGHALSGATKSIGEWGGEAKEKASEAWHGVGTKVDGAVESTRGALAEAGSSVGQLQTTIREGFTDSASKALQGVGSTLGGSVDSTRGAFTGASNSITEFGSEARSRVEEAFASSKSAALGAASSIDSELSKTASTAVHGVGSTLGDAVGSFNEAKSSISNLGTEVGSSLSSTVDRAGSALEGARASVSSAVEHGGATLEDAVGSTREAFSRAGTSVSSVVDQAGSTIGNAASSALKEVDSTLNRAVDNTREAFSGASNSITDFGSSISDSASSAAHNVESTLGDAASSMSQFGTSTLNRAGSTLEGAVDSTKNAIGDAASSVSEFGSSLGDRASTAAHSVSESLGDAASSVKNGLGDTLNSVGNRGSEWLSSAKSSLGSFGSGITNSISSAANQAGQAIDSTAQEAGDSSSSFFSSVTSKVSGWFSSSATATPSEAPTATDNEAPVIEDNRPGLISNIGSTLVNWIMSEDPTTTPAPEEETTTTTETPQTTTEEIPTEPPPSAFASVGSTLISWLSSSVAKSEEAAQATTMEPEITTEVPEAATEAAVPETTTEGRPGLIVNAGSAVYNWLTSENPEPTVQQPDETTESPPEATTAESAVDDETTTAVPEDAVATESPSTFSSMGSTIISWFSSSGSGEATTPPPSEAGATEDAESTTVAVTEGVESTTSEVTQEPTDPSLLTTIGNTVSGWFSSSSVGGSEESTVKPPDDSTARDTSSTESTTAAAVDGGADVSTTPFPEDTTGTSFLGTIGDTVSGWFSSSSSSGASETSTETSVTVSTEESTGQTGITESTTSTPEAGSDETSTVASPEDSTSSSFLNSIGDTVSGWFSSSSASSNPESGSGAGETSSTTETPSITEVASTVESAPSATGSGEEDVTTPAAPDDSTSTSFLSSIGDRVSGWFSSSSASDSPAGDVASERTKPDESTTASTTAVVEESTTPTAAERVIDPTNAAPDDSTSSSLLTTIGDTVSGWFGSSSSSSSGPPSDSLLETTATSPPDFGTPSSSSIVDESVSSSSIPFSEAATLVSTTFSFLNSDVTTLPVSEASGTDSSTQSPEMGAVQPSAPGDQASTAVPEGSTSNESPSTFSTVGSTIISWFAGSGGSSEAPSVSETTTTSPLASEAASYVAEGAATAPSIQDPNAATIEATAFSFIAEALDTTPGIDLTTTLSAPSSEQSTTPLADGGAAESAPETTDPSIISTIGSTISGWLSSSTSETPTGDRSATPEDQSSTPTLPSETVTESTTTLSTSVEETSTVMTGGGDAPSVTEQSAVDTTAAAPPSIEEKETSPIDDITDHAGLITSVGSTIASWFSSSNSGSPETSDFIKPDREESTTMTSSEVEIPAVTTQESMIKDPYEPIVPAVVEETTTSVSATSADVLPHFGITSTVSTNEITTETSSGGSPSSGEPSTSSPFDFTTASSSFETSTRLISEAFTSSPFDFTSTSSSAGDSVLSGDGAAASNSISSTTQTPEERMTSSSPLDAGVESNTITIPEHIGSSDTETTTESPRITVNEITDDVTSSSSAASSSEGSGEDESIQSSVVHAWTWLEQHIGNKSTDWKHIWEWMNEDEEKKKAEKNAVTGHTKPATHHNLWPWVHEQSRDSSLHQQRSDRGLTHSLAPQWLWDKASGTVRYTRESPTPTVEGKKASDYLLNLFAKIRFPYPGNRLLISHTLPVGRSVCSAMLSTAEFDNDDRGVRRVRSPYNSVPYADYDYYWDARFLPVIARPQRRSICTHLISVEEMDEEVELGNGTRFTALAWSCPPLQECCEWECCTRVGGQMWLIYRQVDMTIDCPLIVRNIYLILLLVFLIAMCVLCVFLVYYFIIVRKNRAKTAPEPFAVYVSPPRASSSYGAVPHFGPVPAPPGTVFTHGTQPNQLYGADPDPTSFMPPPPAYNDAKYYV